MTESPLIAVVDDDVAIRHGLSSLLRSAGYAVALYGTAEAFLSALPDAAVQCVVSDIQMPGINGLELQAIVARERPQLPVILMTAYPQPGLRDRAIGAGAVDLLSKPFEADLLLGALHLALRS